MEEPLDEENPIELRYYKQWLAAEVRDMADGSQRKANKAGKLLKVPPGWCFLAYDDGHMEWTRLQEEKFNTMANGSWRLDLDEPDGDAVRGMESGEDDGSGDDGHQNEEAGSAVEYSSEEDSKGGDSGEQGDGYD